MQDRETGEMVPVGMGTMTEIDAAIPDKKRQGCVLRMGERVKVKGGDFVVESIGRLFVRLRGVPRLEHAVESHDWDAHVKCVAGMSTDAMCGKGPTRGAFVANLRTIADMMEAML